MDLGEKMDFGELEVVLAEVEVNLGKMEVVL